MRSNTVIGVRRVVDDNLVIIYGMIDGGMVLILCFLSIFGGGITGYYVGVHTAQEPDL
jgi:hypothetical protein